jgi:hypothetical protein
VDITRNGWFKVLVAVASVISVTALLRRVGLFGAGHYSTFGFAIYALAVLGLDRLLGGMLGMIWVIVVPAEKLAAPPRN